MRKLRSSLSIAGQLSTILLAASLSWSAVADMSGSCAAIVTGKRLATNADWLASEAKIAIKHLMANISPPDSKPGAVIAAQTRKNPNYYYHWVRDAGLVIQAIIEYLDIPESLEIRAALKQKVEEYLKFSTDLQNTPSRASQGEVKFNTDGTAFNEDWGRPQNDGPAIRASSFIAWANRIGDPGAFWKQITRDLDYLLVNWNKDSYDIWEDVLGRHFHTLMVQRRAFREGAIVARLLGDTKRAEAYDANAEQIEKLLKSKLFWDEALGMYIVTDEPKGGFDNKESKMDIAVLMGFLHGIFDGDTFMPLTDPRVQATVDKLVAKFNEIYPINKDPNKSGVAMGRYPEDSFDGPSRTGGNPWSLATLETARFHYKKAEAVAKLGQCDKAAQLILMGHQFVDRVREHQGPGGALNEQFHRDDGSPKSVEHLTWGYATVIWTHAALIRSEAALKQCRGH